MSWLKKSIVINEVEVLAMVRNNHCQFSASQAVDIGDEITIDGNAYKVIAIELYRDEAIITEVEKKDDKSVKRGARGKSSRRNLPSKNDTGHDNSSGAGVGDEHIKDSSDSISIGIDDRADGSDALSSD